MEFVVLYYRVFYVRLRAHADSLVAGVRSQIEVQVEVRARLELEARKIEVEVGCVAATHQ